MTLIQDLHAAISRRDWSAVEVAANRLRDADLEKLLASKSEECANLANSLDGSEHARSELTARVKELEKELTDRKHGGRWSEMVDALEAELAAERAEKEKWKVRGDQHWDTLRSIREMAREGDCERIILWVNDAGSGYTEPLEATVKSLFDKAVALDADNSTLAARVKTLEQVNAKLCDDVIDYELKIAEQDVSLNELKQKLADKFSFTSDDDALAVLERYGHKETGNGIIKADMRSLDDMCRAAVAYLCAEWDFVFQDEVEINREALEAKLAAAERALEPFADHANDRAVDDTGWRDKDTVKIVVSVGDLRKARAALGGKPS